MKKQVSPVVAVVIIVLIIAIAVFLFMRQGAKKTSMQDQPEPMPPDVAAEFQRRMGGMTPGQDVTGGGGSMGAQPTPTLPSAPSGE